MLKELNKELMLVAWHPRRWWNFCMSDEEKIEVQLILLNNAFSASFVYDMEVLEYFATSSYIWRHDTVQKNISENISNNLANKDLI